MADSGWASFVLSTALAIIGWSKWWLERGGRKAAEARAQREEQRAINAEERAEAAEAREEADREVQAVAWKVVDLARDSWPAFVDQMLQRGRQDVAHNGEHFVTSFEQTRAELRSAAHRLTSGVPVKIEHDQDPGRVAVAVCKQPGVEHCKPTKEGFCVEMKFERTKQWEQGCRPFELRTG